MRERPIFTAEGVRVDVSAVPFNDVARTTCDEQERRRIDANRNGMNLSYQPSIQDVEGNPLYFCDRCRKPTAASMCCSLTTRTIQLRDLRVAKERPILFSAPMIRALLANRKTQTRRIINPQPPSVESVLRLSGSDYHWMNCADLGKPDEWRPVGPVWAVMKVIESTRCSPRMKCKPRLKCKHGKAGDRLWCREGSIQLGHEHRCRNGQYRWPSFDNERGADWFDGNCLYTADLERNSRYYDEPHGTLNKLFMPRWASRITLEMTEVRVERLQSITEEDAIAEGVQCAGVPASLTNRGAFAKLWEQINGRDSWAANPWVWAISFKRVESEVAK